MRCEFIECYSLCITTEKKELKFSIESSKFVFQPNATEIIKTKESKHFFSKYEWACVHLLIFNEGENVSIQNVAYSQFEYIFFFFSLTTVVAKLFAYLNFFATHLSFHRDTLRWHTVCHHCLTFFIFLSRSSLEAILLREFANKKQCWLSLRYINFLKQPLNFYLKIKIYKKTLKSNILKRVLSCGESDKVESTGDERLN